MRTIPKIESLGHHERKIKMIDYEKFILRLSKGLHPQSGAPLEKTSVWAEPEISNDVATFLGSETEVRKKIEEDTC